MGYDIFISYRRDDTDAEVRGAETVARHLKVRLEQDWYFEVFLDQGELLPGQDWSERIQNALTSAHTVVVVFCKNCLRVKRDNDVFLREIRCSLERKVQVIPVFLEGFDRKELPGELQFPSQGIFWKDLHGPFDTLADQIGRVIGPNSALTATLDTQIRLKVRTGLQDDGKFDWADKEFKDVHRLVERFRLPPQMVQAVISQEERMYAERRREPVPSTEIGPGGGSSVKPPSTQAASTATRLGTGNTTGAAPAAQRLQSAVGPETDSVSGPTRYARKYIEDMEPALSRVCWAMLAGLPASIVYHYERASDCIWFHHKDWGDWNVTLRVRPRLKRLDVLPNAGADDELGDGTTFLQRLEASGAPNVEGKYSGWSGDYRICCALDDGSSPEQVAAVKGYVAWFCLVAPEISAKAEAAVSGPAKASARASSGGPTRFARKYIEEAEEGLRDLCWSLLRGLPPSVEFHFERDTECIYFHDAEKPSWLVVFRIRPRLHRLDVVINSMADEELADGSSVLERLRSSGAPGVESRYSGWQGDYRIACQLDAGSNEQQVGAVHEFIRWYLLEAPKLEKEED